MIEKKEKEIIQNWFGDISKPLVSIRCTTYNHEKYIADALDGFLIQETNFPFEIIVHDDASTDDTAKIIKEYEAKYPAIVKPIYEAENQDSKNDDSMSRIIKKKMRGKYIAFCEGDDYWTDPGKLQMQIDYMEQHAECEMTYTNFDILKANGQIDKSLFTTNPEDFPHNYTIDEWILSLGYVGPMTWVFTRNIYDKFIPLKSVDGTFVLFAHFLMSTDVHCFDQNVTAVYRILRESASHSDNLESIYRRLHNLYNVQKALIERYRLSKDLEESAFDIYMRSIWPVILILDKKDERESAYLYCNTIRKKVVWYLSKYKIGRILLKKVYILRNRIRRQY